MVGVGVEAQFDARSTREERAEVSLAIKMPPKAKNRSGEEGEEPDL